MMGTIANRLDEQHAIIIGSFVGLATGLAGGKDAAWLLIILATIGLGRRKARVGHLQDVQNEPVYAFGSAMGMFLVTVFIINPLLRGGVL